MPDNLNQPKVMPEVPLEPAPEIIAAPTSPNSSVTPTQPIPPNPPTPPIPPPPLPKSEILTPDITSKKPSKTKIILVSLVGLFLLGAVAGAVVLVQQRQQTGIKAEAPPGCCQGPCSELGCGGCDSNEKCDISNGACAGYGDYSCRSISGCLYDSDCGPGNSCVNGQCGGTGGGTFNCDADGNGVSAVNNTGSTKTVTITYFTGTCALNPPACGCGGPPTTTTATLENGGTWSRSSSTTCGAWQTDIDVFEGGNNICSASDHGCDSSSCTTPTITRAPTATPTIQPTPTPTIPGFSPSCPENIMCAEGFHACTGPDGCPSCCPDGFTPSCPENIMCSEEFYACTGPDGCPSCCPFTCDCLIIKVYNTSWKQYLESALSGIKPGTSVIFTVQGSSAQGTIDQARFKINDGSWITTTSKKAGTNEYYIQYTIPVTATSMKIAAEVHLKETGDWY